MRIYSAQSLTYLLSQRIFQAQAVHGIAVISKSDCHVVIIVWGGSLVRVCKFDLLLDEENANVVSDSWIFSASVEAPDWILHLSPSPLFADDSNTVKVPVCAAVTAHNALLELRTTYTDEVPEISITELTFSTRSILYSAHLVWASRDQILIAAGTAFGEIIFWSWTSNLQAGSASQTHRVFLGHEGSIFGVRISREYESVLDGKPQRFLASCSDDRTIRIWDVSNISSSEEQSGSNEALGNERTHHTGFTNPSFDLSTSSDCLAIGWGHISRVWGVQFLDHVDKVSDVFLFSSGEDATTRTWCLSPNNDVTSKTEGALPYSLSQLDIAAYHSGKNIWASTIHSYLPQMQQMFSCGADSKITVCSMGTTLPLLGHAGCVLSETTIEDIILPPLGNLELDTTNQEMHSHKPSKVLGFFRSYTFVDDTSYLLTTNTGNVYLGLIKPRQSIDGTDVRSQTKLIGQSQDLNGYSVSTGVSSLGIAFVAGSRGHVYAYQRDNGLFTELHATGGKVGSIFAVAHHDEGRKGVVLFFTVTGRDVAQLLHLMWSESGILTVSKQVDVPIAVAGSGLTVTSMGYVASGSSESHLFLGFRQGSVAMYCTDVTITSEEATTPSISYIQTIAGVHGKETVTSLSWLSSESQSGYLISTGRDGHLVIHSFHPTRKSLNLVHRLNLPVGSNIEGAHLIQGNLQVYGFSSKHFVLYDVTAEEELISVDTGGAHRSWAFQPHMQSYGCGTLVWTRASSMHICQQTHSSHEVVRRGGHGREIKAVAVTNPTNKYQFIATGAEDTDIKIFQYEEGNFIGGRTLRKHKTGIQHLQWSEDGSYLFSSGGCEEFYIWKVSTLPPELGTIGVVCESVYQPESEHADLRLMSFDVKPYNASFCISMVFSDSNIKVSARWLHARYWRLTCYRCTTTTRPAPNHGTPFPRALTSHLVLRSAFSFHLM